MANKASKEEKEDQEDRCRIDREKAKMLKKHPHLDKKNVDKYFHRDPNFQKLYDDSDDEEMPTPDILPCRPTYEQIEKATAKYNSFKKHGIRTAGEVSNAGEVVSADGAYARGISVSAWIKKSDWERKSEVGKEKQLKN